MRKDPVRGQLDLLLLAILSDGPAHGYAVIQELHERSHGAFDLHEGTVYPALHKLEAEGLLSSKWATAGGRKRRVYALSQKGRTALQLQAREWSGFVSAMRKVLEA